VYVCLFMQIRVDDVTSSSGVRHLRARREGWQCVYVLCMYVYMCMYMFSYYACMCV